MGQNGQQVVNGLILATLIALGVLFTYDPNGVDTAFASWVPFIVALLAFVLGVLFTIPIGGADMPVVISLLNSYSGLADGTILVIRHAADSPSLAELSRVESVRFGCGTSPRASPHGSGIP